MVLLYYFYHKINIELAKLQKLQHHVTNASLIGSMKWPKESWGNDPNFISRPLGGTVSTPRGTSVTLRVIQKANVAGQQLYKPICVYVTIYSILFWQLVRFYIGWHPKDAFKVLHNVNSNIFIKTTLLVTYINVHILNKTAYCV